MYATGVAKHPHSTCAPASGIVDEGEHHGVMGFQEIVFVKWI